MEQWEYKMPNNIKGFDVQEDWNQTLITKFNKIKENCFFDVAIVFIPIKFLPLMRSLYFYSDDAEYEKEWNKKGRLTDVYIIEYIDEDSNIIDVGGEEKIEILNYQ